MTPPKVRAERTASGRDAVWNGVSSFLLGVSTFALSVAEALLHGVGSPTKHMPKLVTVTRVLDLSEDAGFRVTTVRRSRAEW